MWTWASAHARVCYRFVGSLWRQSIIIIFGSKISLLLARPPSQAIVATQSNVPWTSTESIRRRTGCGPCHLAPERRTPAPVIEQPAPLGQIKSSTGQIKVIASAAHECVYMRARAMSSVISRGRHDLMANCLDRRLKFLRCASSAI